MRNIDPICVLPNTSFYKVLEILDQTGLQILLVVDEQKRLLGTLTDGDIRRSLLKSSDLDHTIESVYKQSPRCAKVSQGREAALNIMQQYGIDQVPIIDDKGVVVGLEVFHSACKGLKIKNPVIIMAGGLGKRLYPLTSKIPKALAPISDKPILEIIMNKFIVQGFSNFIFCVNYKSEMIKSYFQNGSRWNVSIRYIEEEKKLGTAGALSIIPQEDVSLDAIVMNCDILTTENFQDLLEFHGREKSAITASVREVHHEIPYGVVELKDKKILSIIEKPNRSYYVNAGIYVISPEAFNLIPKNTFFNMTDLIDLALKKAISVSAFPIYGYWLDVGQIQDLEKARINSQSQELL